MLSIASVTTAAARFTNDSSASDSSPTEPVSHQAPALSAIVATAAAIDSHANLTSEVRLMFPARREGADRGGRSTEARRTRRATCGSLRERRDDAGDERLLIPRVCGHRVTEPHDHQRARRDHGDVLAGMPGGVKD